MPNNAHEADKMLASTAPKGHEPSMEVGWNAREDSILSRAAL